MHIIIQTVVLVLTGLLTLCLVLCIGCEWIDTHPFEPFNVDSSETETEDTTYTPELTYFTISVDNPNDNVMSSSEYLQQKKREQQRGASYSKREPTGSVGPASLLIKEMRQPSWPDKHARCMPLKQLKTDCRGRFFSWGLCEVYKKREQQGGVS